MSYYKKFEMVARGRGLNFDYLLSGKNYKAFAESLLNRENPVFYDIFDKDRIIHSKIFGTTTGMNIIKLKLLLDIVYYKEYIHFDKPAFRIAD